MKWLLLVLALPSENAATRQRAWRALRAAGAGSLRDGVYLLPASATRRATLDEIAADVVRGSGTALVLETSEPPDAAFPRLFDRAEDYAALLREAVDLQRGLQAVPASDGARQARRLRRAFDQIAAIDFFPGDARERAAAAVEALEQAVARALDPDEPQAVAQPVPQLAAADFQNQLWATRRRPWVDRLASAWLIRRCIDADARILWLRDPADLPAGAVGFDFDGARFTHVGERVTFEVLLASFGLAEPALGRLGQLVHNLDVGGTAPPEAAGVERVLAGLRATHAQDDDALLAAALPLFDALRAAYHSAGATP